MADVSYKSVAFVKRASDTSPEYGINDGVVFVHMKSGRVRPRLFETKLDEMDAILIFVKEQLWKGCEDIRHDPSIPFHFLSPCKKLGRAPGTCVPQQSR